jgi:hypothetical protein
MGSWVNAVLGLAAGLAVNECSDVSPWLARRLVRWAAGIRYPGREDELEAVIDDRPGKLLKLLTALGFVCAALIYRFTCRRRSTHRFSVARGIASDVTATVIAVLDVWLVFPKEAQTYSVVLSTIACAAMLFRRRWPFLAVLVTVPGFLAGWSRLAGMMALGSLAHRRQMHWLTWTGAFLVFLSNFMLWPIDKFLHQSLQSHLLLGIYSGVYASMPVAIGLLIAVRGDLSARIAQLAASRDRESRLQAE